MFKIELPMKDLIKSILLLSVLLVSIVSCDKDEKSESDSETMLIGNWKAVSSSRSDGEWTVSYEDGLNNMYYEFRADGTCSGNVAVIELVPVEGSWVLSSGKLTIENEEYKMEYEVSKLDDSNLILHLRWESGDTIYYEIAFKKVKD